MVIKGRLALIAKKVPECGTVCDVGTDHAYVPINLIKKNICKKVIATDIKQGPILVAEKNIKSNRLGQMIETRVGNGLKPLKEGEADVLIISGMGGILITEILEEGINKAKDAKLIILQPMYGIDIARKWLYKNGFCILDEELVEDLDRIYNVIVARWDGCEDVDDDVYYYVGKELIEKKDPLLKTLLERNIRIIEKIVQEMKNTKNSESKIKDRYLYIKNRLSNVLDSIN